MDSKISCTVPVFCIKTHQRALELEGGVLTFTERNALSV
jgi:hypothetical protein